MDSQDAKQLIKQLTRIADAMEENNKLKKKEVVIEKRRYNRDFPDISETEQALTEEKSSQS